MDSGFGLVLKAPIQLTCGITYIKATYYQARPPASIQLTQIWQLQGEKAIIVYIKEIYLVNRVSHNDRSSVTSQRLTFDIIVPFHGRKVSPFSTAAL